MRPAENINDLIKKLQLKASTDLDKRVHDDISKAPAESDKTESARAEPNIWRTIMKSPVVKPAVAAVIIVVCYMGLRLWNSTSSGIALAEVLTRIEQVTGYAYQMQSTITRQQISKNLRSSLLVSQEHGIRIISKSVDPNNSERPSGETYLLTKSNSIVFVMHERKEYYRMIYDGTKLDYYKEEYNDPRIIIQQFLSCDHISLGQSLIDGITVEGFQTTDLAYKGGFMGLSDLKSEPVKVDVKIWVDVNTFLPVRSEEDITTKQGSRVHEISYDFRWKVVLNADDFVPNIPGDYTAPNGDITIPAFNEETAIKGLRIYADTAGAYPTHLKFSYIKRNMKPTGSPTSGKDLSHEEKTKKTSEKILAAGTVFFYKTLVEEMKDPAYYGETVGPEDADKVLLRWKQEDGRYRVIFGDLNIKTVTAEELDELEKLSLE